MSWTSTKLGDLCKISIGKTPPRKDSQYWDVNKETNNIWLSISDLKNIDSNHYISDSSEYLSDQGSALFKPIEKGTLLLSFKLTIGRMAFAAEELRTNEAIAALPIFDKNKIHKKYLFYYLQSIDWNELTRGDVKLKGKTLNKEKLKNIQILYPPLTVQKQIVEKLDAAFADIDKAIRATEKNIENAEALFSKKMETIFLNLKKESIEAKFEDVTKAIYAGGDAPPKNKRSKEKTDQFFIPIFSNGVKDSGLYGYTNYARTEEPAITISARGTIGHVEVRNEPFLPIVRLITAIPDPKKIDLIFLKYSILSSDIFSTGASIPQLTVPMIKRLTFPLPSIKNQKRVNNSLELIRTHIIKLKKAYLGKIRELNSLKSSILNQAFSGELTRDAA